MVLFSSLTTAPRHWLAWLRINGILGSMDENNTAATDEAAALLVIPSATEPLFTFGTRQCTWYMLIQEILMGFVLILPITIILGQIVLRMNCSNHIVSIIQKVGIRADLWNATTALIVADLILELLIPSAKCLPTMEMFPYPKQEQQQQQGLLLPLLQAWLLWFGEWFKTLWGLDCYIVMEHDILTPFALFGILSIRFTFVVLGLSLGQSFAPIAITGGIGTGKSTIVQMLLNPSQKNMKNNNSKQGKKSETEEDEEESYSFYVIDCDKIGHEILLPSEVLALSNNYSVQPRESVYKAVCQTFQEYDIFVDNDNNNDKDPTLITTTTRPSSTTSSSNQKNDNNNNNKKDLPKQIDRTKLGTIVFANANKRYQLNQITHARIFWILLKHCLYGCWILSGIDFTIVEVPLLYESKSWLLRSIFCMTLMVTVPNEQIQLERIQLRNPELSIQECQNRIHSQMSLTQKEQYADFVLMNYYDHCDNNNNHDDQNEHGDHHHSEATTRTRTTTIQAELFQRIVERGWVDRLFGIGVSVAQIVGIVGLTLAAGVAYYLYHRPFVPNNI